VFGDKAVKISGDFGEEVISYIDDDYVGIALSDEYRYEGIPEEFADYSDSDLGSLESEEADKDLDYRGEVFHASSVRLGRRLSTNELGASFDKEVKPLKSLDDVLKGIYKDSFEKHLQKLINKKGLKNSEVYAAANISKQYFSRIMKGKVNPSKKKVLALAVGLRLNLDETVDFLRIAGYALSPISQTDAVVRYFIENKEYNVIKIDIVLFDYGLDPLSND
jgi:transcriptional regulator with XRE-family HTH domain